jgi:hypothetical protein
MDQNYHSHHPFLVAGDWVHEGASLNLFSFLDFLFRVGEVSFDDFTFSILDVIDQLVLHKHVTLSSSEDVVNLRNTCKSKIVHDNVRESCLSCEEDQIGSLSKECTPELELCAEESWHDVLDCKSIAVVSHELESSV